jgi:hypothetical protein
MSRRSRLFVTTAVKDWGKSPLSRVPDTEVPYDPGTLSPELWLDASDTTTITAAGGAVSQWNNKGSLGNFTQATGAVQPTTGATTLNSLNVIDLAADYLTAADTNEWKFLHDGTKYIVAMVAKINSGSGGYFGSNGGTGAKIGIYWYSDNTTSAESSATNGSSAVFSNVTTSTISTSFVIHSSVVDPSNGTAANRSEMFFNAGTAIKNNTATDAVSSSNPTHALQIGALGNNVFPLTGSIAELVIVSGGNATETNRAALRNYLNDKWAVY